MVLIFAKSEGKVNFLNLPLLWDFIVLSQCILQLLEFERILPVCYPVIHKILNFLPVSVPKRMLKAFVHVCHFSALIMCEHTFINLLL
jgi:hypothetical protein